jgi:putative membrane protein
MMIKSSVLIFTLWAIPYCVSAADESPDVLFYRRAAAAGQAEVAGGQLAQQHGKRALVITFGQMMQKDHANANAILRGLALANHVDLPDTPAPDQTSKLAALQNLSGDAFDKAYIEWQILSHRDALVLFKEESASGDDIDAKRFATDTLPILQSHLDQLLAMPVVMTPSPQS